jgi:hypothetical protein
MGHALAGGPFSSIADQNSPSDSLEIAIDGKVGLTVWKAHPKG